MSRRAKYVTKKDVSKFLLQTSLSSIDDLKREIQDQQEVREVFYPDLTSETTKIFEKVQDASKNVQDVSSPSGGKCPDVVDKLLPEWNHVCKTPSETILEKIKLLQNTTKDKKVIKLKVLTIKTLHELKITSKILCRRMEVM